MYYFDYAATTRMGERALEAYIETAKHFYGNSESLHDIGSNAHEVVEKGRKFLEEFLQVPAHSIYFTSGGTEGNLLSIISLAKGASKKGKHIISSMAEHTSVHSALSYLEENGYEITKIPFLNNGTVDLEQLKKAVRPDTILVTIQHVNQEIGTIQPIKEISNMIRGEKILFHTDCVQSFGKIDVKSIIPYVDSITISSHKVYGPKGVGAVYMNPSSIWKPVFPGLTHENGFRGGTVNIPGIISFIVAVEEVPSSDHLKRDWELRKAFQDIVRDAMMFIEGEAESQLPSIIGGMISHIEGQLVMLECNKRGFAISTGSACQEGQEGGVKAVEAIGYSSSAVNQFFRISFGKHTTEEEIIYLGKTIKEIAYQYNKK
ncbi:IscS subfamily cysteine desulfurase [Heyndrickxia ginsengihumi]|uniref:Aminotransferase class V-fold PLP-dependent enzyme n=1 Tax=Heyndrickxia ginsengihumi TaxID=363870 RepID=A0A0A6VDF0_9BACI|nr:IscS subfamily cysteine desulfurase [Heyndrickxia ginsengihumi]KHD84564.1 cysteine desulfurase [Heyndrickxia ginsengihumi]NEY19453.1 aminotransferase class V-fold PLP-dependent enzyme [Heyndrickxia ginsengihumi]